MSAQSQSACGLAAQDLPITGAGQMLAIARKARRLRFQGAGFPRLGNDPILSEIDGRDVTQGGAGSPCIIRAKRLRNARATLSGQPLFGLPADQEIAQALR
ncbi:MAG: hypothetical protein AAF293_00155 [Pseudomonadota bacterium]